MNLCDDNSKIYVFDALADSVAVTDHLSFRLHLPLEDLQKLVLLASKLRIFCMWHVKEICIMETKVRRDSK